MAEHGSGERKDLTISEQADELADDGPHRGTFGQALDFLKGKALALGDGLGLRP